MSQQPLTTLHVICDPGGCWRVVDEAAREPLSEHWSATEAERAAWRHARAGTVLLHDRYGRTHAARRPNASA